jgi:hypothetical protein
MRGIVLVMLMACGGGSKGAEEPNGNGGGAGGGGGGEGVTLVSIAADGGSCRAVVKDASGGEVTHAADSALCPGGASDASGLVGKQVALEMGAGGASPLPAGEDPCRDVAPPCGADASGPQMVIAITAAP